MDTKSPRALTNLEYIVLGLIGLQPQTGYDIVQYFEEGQYSWSASPGSIYPILKRLENQDMLEGLIEAEHEARPRKVYHLTELGGTFLDAWLRLVPRMRPFYEQRELGLLRFQFMEARFTVQETIEWLDGYLDTLRVADAHRKVYQEAVLSALTEMGKTSTYRQIILEAAMMEQNNLRLWLEMARTRMIALAHQTGEFRAVDIETDK